MKKLILTLVVIAATCLADIEPSALTFTVGASGAPAPSDARAIRYIVNARNAQLLAAGQSQMPSGTAAELKNSYLQILSVEAKALHGANIAASVSADALKVTDEDLKSIRAAIADKLAGGTTAAQIITLLK